jgi:polyisoprenoid-binding protein YceI
VNLSRSKVLAGTLVLASAGVVGGAWLVFFTPEAPEPVKLDTSGDQSPASVRIMTSDPAGRWVIRQGSEAGYRVREKLARLPAASDAAGRTERLSGGFRVTGEDGRYSVTSIEVEVDMASLTSDSPKRDETLRQMGLQTDSFPTASFRSPGPVEIPEDLRSGETMNFRIDGALTLHGVTRHVSIPIQARLRSEILEVVGSLTMHMADFGIEPPNVANIVSVEPTGTMEFRLVLEKAD